VKKKKTENKCGACHYCCEVLTFAFPGMPDFEAKSFYQTRGVDFKYGRSMTYATIEYPCIHLKKGFGCQIYEKRPKACRELDGRRNPVTKDRCELK
jgi:Fe-S-cluster containining protein